MATIGRVDFKVDFDGKDLPLQARKIGNDVGTKIGQGLDAGLSKEMGKLARDLELDFGKIGTESGSEFSKSLNKIIKGNRKDFNFALASMLGDRSVFDDFIKSSGGVEAGLDRITVALNKARESGMMTTHEFQSANATFRNWSKTLKDGDADLTKTAGNLTKMGKGMGDFDKHTKKANGSSKGFFKQWKELPHGFRQLTFYIALFAALGSEIAILGSAAGSSLAILGGALAAFGVGVGIAVAAFKGLNKPLAELPAASRPAAQAFQDFTKGLDVLQDKIQAAAGPGLVAGFTTLQTIITQLTPVFEAFGASFGAMFAQITAGLAPGTRGFELLQIFIEGSQKILEAFIPVITALGTALGEVFAVAQPFIVDFANGLAGLLNQFVAWTQTVEGNQALTEWFENGQTIINALLPLLASAGLLLNSLVTPETIAAFVALTENLTTFLDLFLGPLLGSIATLNPFGLIAQALAELSEALAPAMPAIETFAKLLNGILSEAITTLAPLIGSLVVALLPVVNVLLELAGNILNALLPALEPLVDAFVAALPALMPLINALAALLMPVIQALTPLIAPLADIFLKLIQIVLPPLTTLVEALTPVILQLVEAFIPLIDPILQIVTLLLDLIGPILSPLIELIVALAGPTIDSLVKAFEFLTPVLEFVVVILEAFSPLIEAIMQILGGLINFITGVFTGDWEKAWGGIRDVFAGIWNGIVGIVEGAINALIGLINTLLKGINSLGKDFGIKIPLIAKVNFSGARLAAGAFVDSPTHALIGENGPEAVVPLNRPLGAVDPDVRNLSAILQGKPVPGATDNSRGATVEAGAIQIIGVRDPERAASAMLDRLVAKVA